MKSGFELSLAIGLAVMLLCCVAAPHGAMQWWGVAFSPLCDGVLTAELSGGDIIFKSKLCELLLRLFP